MGFEPFAGRFIELGLKETRTLTVIDHAGLPAGEKYGLMELYCSDQNCDCRRVMFDVVSKRQNQSMAVIAYGWESASYYARWYGENDPVVIRSLQGPELNFGSQQSEFAPLLLELVKEVIKDPFYVARLKKHYQMFKETVDRRNSRLSAALDWTFTPKPLPIPGDPAAPTGRLSEPRKRHRSR
jgi:hypothetical protein